MLTGHEKRKCPEDARDLQEAYIKRQKPETDAEKKEEKTLSPTNEQKQQLSQNSAQPQVQLISQPLQNTDKNTFMDLIDEAHKVYLFFEDTVDGVSDFKREQKVVDGLKDEMKKADRSSTEYVKIYTALSQIYGYRYGQLIRGEYGVYVENEKKLQEESKVLCNHCLDQAEKYLLQTVQENHGQLDLRLYEKCLDTRILFYDSIYEYEDANFRREAVQVARAAAGAFPNSFHFLQLLADVLAYENPFKNDIRNEDELREAKQYYQAALQADPFNGCVCDKITEIDEMIAELEDQQQDGLKTLLASSALSINPYSFIVSSSTSSSCVSHTSARSPSLTSSTAPSE